MILFLLRALRSRASVRPTVVFALCSASLPQVLPAQTGTDLFRGTWQVETPGQGTLIVLLKRNQLASHFWADTADRTVYQGEWSLEGDIARLSWPDGSAHRLERDDLGFGITALDANGNTRYSAPARQVPQEVLGQWAKAPESEREDDSDRDRAKGFFGIWEIEGDTPHYVVIEPDRSAASTWSPREGETRGLRGAWAKQGSELHVAWDSGHYSVFRENPRGFTYRRIPPGTALETAESGEAAAARVSESNLPPAWSSEYNDEQSLRSGGIAFADRKEARKFYRGTWVVPQAGERYEQIDIGRFGGLSTGWERSLRGDWILSGQDVFMRWDNGLRQILSPVGWGFVLYEYQPGRPLDGVPNKIYAAAPTDTEKLAAHLKERADVARQMLAMAEAAGIDPNAEDAGWGRTFMRWVWPTGDEEDAGDASARDMLETEYETTSGGDPWWWPFWSERRVPAREAAGEAAAAEAPEAADDSTSEEAETGESATPEDGGTEEEREEIPVMVDAEGEPETVDDPLPGPAAAPESAPPAESGKSAESNERVRMPSAGRPETWVWPFE